MTAAPRPATDTRRAGLWLGVLMTVLALPAWAGLAPELQRHLEDAEHAYLQLDYERALVAVFSAKRLAGGREEYVAVALCEGIVLSALGRPDEAASAFQAALLRDAHVTLPWKVAPKTEDQFAGVRRQVLGELSARQRVRHQALPPPPLATPTAPSVTPLRGPAPMAAALAAPAPVAVKVRPGPPWPAVAAFVGAGVVAVAGGTLVGLGVGFNPARDNLTFNAAVAARQRAVTEVNLGGACLGVGVAAAGLGFWLVVHRHGGAGGREAPVTLGAGGASF